METTAPQLRIVDQDHVFLVARTLFVTPGRPYVVAELAPDTIVESPPGLERVARTEMDRSPDLLNALEAWTAGDDSLLRREAGAKERVFQRPMSSRERSRAMHPSRLSKQLGERSLRSV